MYSLYNRLKRIYEDQLVFAFVKCCFLLPLNYGCYIIGAFFLSFHVGELITHTNNTIFIKDLSEYNWAPVTMAPVLMAGSLVSVLLIYGAAKRKRGFVLLWVIVYVYILVIFLFLYIYSLVKFKPTVVLIAIQSVIILITMYSLFMVHSFYKYLKTVEHDDVI